jgi:hypothetical protein
MEWDNDALARSLMERLAADDRSFRSSFLGWPAFPGAMGI